MESASPHSTLGMLEGQAGRRTLKSSKMAVLKLMLFRGIFWFPMVLNDPCDPGYITDTLGEGPGSLWEASELPPEPPGVIAGGVCLGSHSALSTFSGLALLASQKSWFLVAKMCAPVRGMERGKLLSTCFFFIFHFLIQVLS